jgi:hypothetical protein
MVSCILMMSERKDRDPWKAQALEWMVVGQVDTQHQHLSVGWWCTSNSNLFAICSGGPVCIASHPDPDND